MLCAFVLFNVCMRGGEIENSGLSQILPVRNTSSKEGLPTSTF